MAHRRRRPRFPRPSMKARGLNLEGRKAGEAASPEPGAGSRAPQSRRALDARAGFVEGRLGIRSRPPQDRGVRFALPDRPPNPDALRPGELAQITALVGQGFRFPLAKAMVLARRRPPKMPQDAPEGAVRCPDPARPESLNGRNGRGNGRGPGGRGKSRKGFPGSVSGLPTLLQGVKATDATNLPSSPAPVQRGGLESPPSRRRLAASVPAFLPSDSPAPRP